ncbi:uncharacterized protein [Dysidea avara]|uniref:uncharacterized protein n=1 Tax=Dysidea avara TaxID=196820 RepID=UPI00331D0460
MLVIGVFVLLGIISFPTGVCATKKVCIKETILPYRQLMTPQWIEGHATISGPYEVFPQYFEILNTTGDWYQNHLQVQLVPPGILKADDSVTVTMIIALDTELADSQDHDIAFGISDNASFVGFTQFDRAADLQVSPCRSIEGDRDNGLLQNRVILNGPLVASLNFSSETKLQIRPAEQWGSCHTEQDEGYTIVANYQHILDLSNGLFLEMYRNQPDEVYRIKYIATDVELD